MFCRQYTIDKMLRERNESRIGFLFVQLFRNGSHSFISFQQICWVFIVFFVRNSSKPKTIRDCNWLQQQQQQQKVQRKNKTHEMSVHKIIAEREHWDKKFLCIRSLYIFRFVHTDCVNDEKKKNVVNIWIFPRLNSFCFSYAALLPFDSLESCLVLHAEC